MSRQCDNWNELFKGVQRLKKHVEEAHKKGSGDGGGGGVGVVVGGGGGGCGDGAVVGIGVGVLLCMLVWLLLVFWLLVP